MAFSGSSFFNLVASNEPTQKKYEAVVSLKTYVKKENVDLNQVQAYFEAIAVLMDLDDQLLQSTTFSLLCHLVKRVSIQDSKSTLLRDHSFLVLPFIITRIADSRASIKISARRALEAYWLTSPLKVEQALVELGLKNRSPLIVNECVVWLNSILTEVNRHLSLKPFMNALAEILVQYESHALLVENIKILFANYYDLKQNRIHKYELQKILESHKVSPALRTSIMGTDQVMKAKDKPELPKASSLPKTTPLSRPTKPKMERKPEVTAQESQNAPLPESLQTHVGKVVATLQNYALDSNVKPLNENTPQSLRAQISEMHPIFDGKETERNWTKREAHIATLRSLLRGNLHLEYPDELAAGFKDIGEGICKGLLSLRTTLSVSACHLVKEAAILLKEAFDPLLDLFIPTLIKLNAATKHMTSSNANLAMCAIIANCTYSGKLLHKIQTASSEKGSNTRTHCGTWLRIFIARSEDQGAFSHPEIVERVLGRLLSDPILPVRQAAKEAFWCLQTAYPDSADRLLARLDANVVRGLERSKPSSTSHSRMEISRPSSRPSIKESILAKNKEINARRAVSRLSLRNASQRSVDDEDPAKKRGYYRHQSDPPSGGRRLEVPAPKSQDSAVERTILRQRSFQNPHQSNLEIQRLKSTNFASILPSNSQEQKNTVSPSDPIFQFLSSSNLATVEEGLNLLRYAILADEKFPDEIQFYLRKVSFTHPESLNLLLNDSLDLFKKSWKLMTPEDALRVCCLNFTSDDHFDRMVAVCDQDIYRSIGTILTYIADFDSIVGEKLLAMQVIKFKPKILERLVQFTAYCTSKIPLNSEAFHRLARPLFALVAVFHSMPYYDKYQILIKQLYEVDQKSFEEQLANLSSSSRRELEILAGLNSHEMAIDFTHGKNESNASLKDLEAKHESGSVDSEARQVETIESELSSISLSATEVLKLSHAAQELNKISSEKEPEIILNTKQTHEEDSMDLDSNEVLTSVASAIKVKQRDEQNDEKAIEDRNAGGISIMRQTVDEKDKQRVDDGDHELGSRSISSHSLTPTSGKDMGPIEDRSTSVEEPERPSPATPDLGPTMETDIDTLDLVKPAPRAKSYSPRKKAVSKVDSNVFASELVTPMRNEFFNRLNSDPSIDLAENFAQVKITNRLNTIQSFIDKVDPLSKVSFKAKPITIFEDTKVGGSPQKVKEYSYTELNWFNFLVATLALDREAQDFEDYTIAEYDQLCEDLKGNIGGKKFVSLLRYLQNEQSAEFDKYFVQEGLGRIEEALDEHFRSSEVSNKLNGLILLKQLLINRESIQFGRLWNNLVLLSDSDSHEVEVAVNEAFDEALCGMFSSGSMIQTIVKYFGEHEQRLSDTAISFIFGCLYKLIAQKTIVLSVNDDLLQELHAILEKYLDHKKVEIRRNVFRTYGKLIRASRVSELTDNNNKLVSSGKDSKIVEEILASLSRPQRELVERYSC